MPRLAAAAAAAALALAFSATANAQVYYVSPTGNDAAAGTSTASPWRTVARVDAAALAPGDSVLFQGGAAYSGLLQPPASGSSGAPITFGGYGSGSPDLSGGIALASRSWLVFDGLTVDTGAWQSSGTTHGIATASSGSGVQNVTVRNCRFANVAIGLLLQSRNDRNWTVSNNVIRYTRDSGILIYDPTQANEVGGSDMTFDGNQILDTGLDSSLAYQKHGVYDIGTDLTWRNNVIRRFADGGFSLRARGNTLVDNTISDGPYAIYYSPYDSTPGTTTIAYNTISNVTGDGIELAASGNVSDVESFVVANNTISSAGTAPGIRLLGTSGSALVANNLVTVSSGPAFRVDRAPGGGLVERNNLWWSTGGTTTLDYLGTGYQSLPAYQAASGRGGGDLAGNPQLGSSLVPASTSPAIDGGTTSIAAGATYVGDCTEASYHYCGLEPDMGSTEYDSPPPTPSAPAPPAPTPPAPPPPTPPTPPAPPPPAQLPAPGAPTAYQVATTGMTVSWKPSAGSQVVGYRLSRSGTVVGTTAQTSLAVSGLACGTSYSFSVVALDAAGDASAAATASLATAACPPPTPPDTTPPTLALTSPTNGQTVPRSFTATATATDGSGVANVTFWLDSSQACVVTKAPYACSISAKPGTHTLRVRATDTRGNFVEQTVSVTVTKSPHG